MHVTLIWSCREGNRGAERKDLASHTARKWPAVKTFPNLSSSTGMEAERCGFKSQLFHLLAFDF